MSFDFCFGRRNSPDPLPNLRFVSFDLLFGWLKGRWREAIANRKFEISKAWWLAVGLARKVCCWAVAFARRVPMRGETT